MKPNSDHNHLGVLDYDEWLRSVFDHPITKPAWHWSKNADVREPPRHVSVQYVTRLFAQPEVLDRYTDAQVNQGLWYVASNSCSNYMPALLDIGEPWIDRLPGIRAIETLFQRLFARRCTDHLSHLDERGAGALNSACYMWWDILPISGQPDNLAYAPLDVELLQIMKRTLLLPSLACLESALHGLGHWHLHYPEFVERTVDEFTPTIEQQWPMLAQYAQAARNGSVL